MSIFKFRKPSAPASIAPANVAISVVIPLYNHARYIEGTLQSVLAQSSPADEIILIDDGSSDNGFDVASRLLANIPYASAYRQENAGAHNTINRAIGLARGDYVAVLNSDDVFTSEKLARCRELIQERPGLGLIAGRAGIMDDHGVEQHTGVAIDWLARAYGFLSDTGLPQLALLNENFVATTSNMVFSRALWQAAGGFQPLRYCHDLDFLMYAFAHSSVYIDQDVRHIVYRVHERNTIKEDLSKVRVEIAAVVAQALAMSGPRLFSARLDGSDLGVFRRFLQNKGMTEMLCFLQTVLPAFPTRSAFYEYAVDARNADAFRSAVTG
ncbi:glycosyltransferase family 2 protein [Burkholderia seminalis]|uniref:glycosyltransferase family 2 protein n=1 Tax=Burkholderia seminalis TaxID=488731 RepID=UPI00158CBC3F|nr:glycosyltransferase family A protein [Burkholderia seminalis]MCA7955131.1 glycosyltransferase family 2 protein [Burkholderia seminalis]